MTDPAQVTDTAQPEPVVVRWPGRDSAAAPGLPSLLAAYHLQTESEKGAGVSDVDALPARYRAEITAPGTAFVDDVVLLARCGAASAGCLVVAAPVAGRSELKRLWTDPAFRGRGIASMLIAAALDPAALDPAALNPSAADFSAAGRVSTVALSVWEWRTGAIGLYTRFGFRVVESWDERRELVCMERAGCQPEASAP